MSVRPTRRRLLLAGALSLALLSAACGGGGEEERAASPSPVETEASPAPEASPTPAEQSPTPEGTVPAAAEEEEAPPAAEVELEIVGKDIQFDKAKLSAPADTPFTVVFDHQDEGVPHNFAIYETGPPGSGLIAATEIETGPVVQELTVDGLAAGTYFYQCDVHPQTMTGTLEVG